MAYNIPEISQSRKTTDILLILAVVVLALLAFGLGRLSVLSTIQTPVALCSATDDTVTSDTALAPLTETSQKKYVASVSGSAYHFPWCSGALRIKEENKVWFATPEEAVAAGYRPASNCKGL